MSRNLLIILSVHLILFHDGIAQTPSISSPVVIKHLLAQQKEIPVITGSFIRGESFKLIPKSEIPKQLWQEAQYLLYTPGNLFIGINGTGRLFRISDQDNELRFTKDDSTFYMGSNFCSANFSVGNKFYSYGGYGFWKNNGLLRYYNLVSHDWEVIQTNREINSISCIDGGNLVSYFWVDAQNQKLYLAGPKLINDGIKSSSISSKQKNNQLFVLDINKGEWDELGKLKEFPNIYWLNSPWGLLFIESNNSFIYDMIHNRKLNGEPSVNEKLKKIFMGLNPDITYFVDSTLYFGNSSYNSFDSILLSINDFKFYGDRVYTQTDSKTKFLYNKNILAIATFSLGLLIIFILYKKIKKKKNITNGIDENQNHKKDSASLVEEQPRNQKFNGKNGNSNQIFSEIEKELILFIYEKTSQEYTVSVEEINKVLGLSGKNESVQKKNRSECINDINKKWSVLEGHEHPLIDRQRSEFDKRSFEYFIQPFWLTRIADFPAYFKNK